MYFNSVKNLQSSWSKALKQSNDKKGLPWILRLSQVIKLMMFKKVDMFIVAYELASEVRLADLKYGLTISAIKTPEQIASLRKVVGLSNYKPYDTTNWLHRIFKNGSIGFIALKNNHPVGCCWASEKTPSNLFPGVRIPLGQGDVCVHTLYVSQLYRRQKIGKALASYRLQFLKNRGYKTALATVEKDNLAALETDKKLGYVTVGEISGLRLLFWSRIRCIKYYNF